MVVTDLNTAGVAVYYLSPEWPYTVNSYVSLDGALPVLVDMTAPLLNDSTTAETVESDVRWSATGLINEEHQVVVTLGAQYAVVDAFM